jgi:hypothetical protein
MLALQSLDTLLIIVYRPFSEASTLQQEITGGITNLLAVTSICVPIVSGGTMPWPDWMNDSFTLITGLFATVMGAILSMIAAVSSLVAQFTALFTMCFGCCSCFASIKVAASAEGGIPTDIPEDVVPEDVPTDELVDTAAENVQGEIDAQQADLVVGYDEKDPFEMEEEGDPQGDEEEGNEEGVNAGVIGVGIAAAAAAAAYHHHSSSISSSHHHRHDSITITFNIDYTSVGEEGSNERAIFNNDLIRDLTAASPGLSPECFEILKLTSEGISPSKDSSTVATSSWQNAMLFLKAPFTWATSKKVDPNLSSGGSLVAEIAIVTQSNNPADMSNVSENLLQQHADPASTLRSGKVTQAIISILIQDSEGNVIPRSQHMTHSQVYQIGTTTHTPRSQVHRLQDEVDIIIHGQGKVCTPQPQENGASHPLCKRDDYHIFKVEEHSPLCKNDGVKRAPPPTILLRCMRLRSSTP